MEWWLTLLIACAPAVISALVSVAISHKQIKQARIELEKQYREEEKLHISKEQYDLEISIYRELSDKCYEMIKNVAVLFPNGLCEICSDEIKRKNRQNALESILEMNDVLKKHAPFISEKFYNEYDDIMELCASQTKMFSKHCFQENLNKTASDIEEENKCYATTEKIFEKYDNLSSDLRKYLEGLKISGGKESKNAN